MKKKVVNWISARKADAIIAKNSLVGAIEKGFERARLSRVEIATNLDLSMVPNYVAYKAALIREKILLQHICLGLSFFVVVLFVEGRIEVSALEGRLRLKEYILAPGVSDFIPVAPQMVPDTYVQHAVSDFIATLGNTNPMNIDERFKQLSSLMSPALQVQFNAEAAEWITKARSENISEMVTILDKRIEADMDGKYNAIVHTRTDSFVGSENIGYRNEVVEMGLRLVPPDIGRRWFLEITSLSRESAEAFDTANGLGGDSHEE
ncbi:MAG: hypothetical protein AB7T49_20215 [Oligoflexales bacterium]